MSLGMYQAVVALVFFLKFRQAAGLGVPSVDGLYFFLAITVVTVFLNLVTATLITLRILYFNRSIQKTGVLESNNPYRRIITICVESSALIVVFGLAYFILYFSAYGASIIPLQILVYVYVCMTKFFCDQGKRN